MWGNRLTHAMTHTQKCAEREKEARRENFVSSPRLFFFWGLTSPVP